MTRNCTSTELERIGTDGWLRVVGYFLELWIGRIYTLSNENECRCRCEDFVDVVSHSNLLHHIQQRKTARAVCGVRGERRCVSFGTIEMSVVSVAPGGAQQIEYIIVLSTSLLLYYFTIYEKNVAEMPKRIGTSFGLLTQPNFSR